MTDNGSIVTTNGGALAELQSRDTLKEIADRLRKMMPSAQSFTEGEALAVAQVAAAHGLDPFTGEVWGLKSQDGKWYGVTVGIKGYRKAARREAAREDAPYWINIYLIDPAEVSEKPGAVVYRADLRDTRTMQAYGKTLNILTTSGVPYKDAIQMIGPAPVVYGIGIATPDERSKMALHARAKKRAEADALKQRYDLHFSGAEVEDVTAADEEPAFTTEFVTGEVVEEKKPEAQALLELGFS